MEFIKIVQSLATVLVLVVTVVGFSPSFRRLNPFWRNGSKALHRLYAEKDTIEFETKSGGTKAIRGGIVPDNQVGFRWVKEAVLTSRPELEGYEEEHGEVTEIGLVQTDQDIDYGGSFGAVIPGNFAYVRYYDGTLYPFIKDELEQRMISTWTVRMIERYTALVVIALMVIWTAVSLWTIWGV